LEESEPTALQRELQDLHTRLDPDHMSVEDRTSGARALREIADRLLA